MADVIQKLYEDNNLLLARLPDTVRNLTFKGTWDASTNTPTLADGTGDTGDYYVVSVAGTQNLGSGDITFVEGDEVIYNGTIWEKGSTGSLNLAQVDENFIPIKNSGVLKNSPLQYDSTLDRLVSDKSIQMPASSIYAGESLRISGANNGLSVYNKATDENFFLVGQQFDPDTLGYRPFMYEYEARDVYDLQILEDETASGVLQFNYTTMFDSIVNCFIVKGNSLSTGVSVKIRIDSHTGPIIREIRNITINATGETIICLTDEQDDEAELIFESGTPLYITVDSADLKGHTVGAQFVPYLRVDRNVYTARNLVDIENIVSDLEAKTGDDRLSASAIKAFSGHSVTELDDVTDAGSGAIITEPERNAIAANSAKVSFPEAPEDGKQYARKDGAWVEVSNNGGVPIYYEESLPISNGGTSYTTKVTLNLPSDFEAGDYFIEVNYGWRVSSTSYDFYSMVTLDASEIGTDVHKQEPQDADNRHPAFRRFKKTLTGGVHTINLDYKSSDSGATPYIWDASITVTKINIQ
jgi:hypothetical protein